MTPVFASQNDLAAMQRAILQGKDPNVIRTRQIKDIPTSFKNWSAGHKEQLSRWKSKPYYVLDNPNYSKYFV